MKTKWAGGESLVVEGLSKKEKGLMDMDKCGDYWDRGVKGD